MRDITLEDTFYMDFTTRAFATGIPTVLAGTPVLSVLEENNATPITAGVSVSVDRASVVGLNMATIVATAANGYEAGKGYSVYISTGTVGGVSVVGEKVGEFTIETIAKTVWDRVLTGGTHNVANSSGRRLRTLQESGGVYGGQVYLDTVDGTAGTTAYENGTSDNPTDLIASAKTIAAAVGGGLHDFHIINGSSVTLAEDTSNESYFGDNWTLILAGQTVTGAHFQGAIVSGIHVGAAEFFDCRIGAITTIDASIFERCSLEGTITLPVGDVYLDDCHHAGTPILDFGAAVANTTVHMHKYAGGIEIHNMGDTGTDVLHLDGNGTLTVNANGSGGTINLRGRWKVTNNGSATINYDDSRDDEMATLLDTDELQTDWTDAGRLDTLLDAIPTTAMRGTDSAATAANLATVDTVVDAIKAVTDLLPDAGALSDLALILTDTGTTLPATLAGLNDVSTAEVLTQVNAALDTAISELAQAAPTATPTLRTGLMLLYMALRDRLDVNTSGTDEMVLYNNAGTAIAKKLITDDGSDYSEAEMITGA